MLHRLKTLLTWPPPQPGQAAPTLSLTAEDGTWIRSPDFHGHLHMLLLFFRDGRDEDTARWLQGIEALRPSIEAAEAVVFGVSTWRTDSLRELRQQLGLGFHLLYDPLAVDARAWRASSRWRPALKDTAVLVDKDGRIAWAERGRVPPTRIAQHIAALSDVEEESPAPATDSAQPTHTRDGDLATHGRAPVKIVGSDKAVKMLEEPASRFILVDVRTTSEYEPDHAPGAIHMPVDELPQRYKELGQVDNILCICQSGGRSSAAAEFLASVGGREIYNVEGGMSGWTGPRVTGGVQE